MTIEVNQTNVTLQLPERLAKHLEVRQSMLREVAVQDYKPTNGKEGNGP